MYRLFAFKDEPLDNCAWRFVFDVVKAHLGLLLSRDSPSVGLSISF